MLLNIVGLATKYWKAIALFFLIIALVTGIFYSGMIKGKHHAEEAARINLEQVVASHNSRIAQYEKQMSDFRDQSQRQMEQLKNSEVEIREVVVTEFVDRVNVVRDQQIVYRDVVRELPPTSQLSGRWVDLHDSAATQTPIPSEPSNTQPVTDVAALLRVSSNYAICEETRQQLFALQTWVRETQAAAAAANGDTQ